MAVPIDTEIIRALRDSKKLTLEEAAKAAGMKSRQRWFNIESGASTNPGIETLEAMAQVLGVSVKKLLK